MKIIQINYSLTSGGGERFVVDLSNELSKNTDNTITLLTIVDDAPAPNRHYLNELSQNVNYVNLHCKHGFSVTSIIKLYQYIKKNKPDIVHIHCNNTLIFFPAIFLRKSKYFITLHSLIPLCLRYKMQKYIDLILFKKGLITPITISKECHKSFINTYNLNKDITIINGRSSLKLSNLLPNVKNEIDSLKNDKEDLIFIHIARFNPVKNQKLLFKAFEELAKKNNHFQLLVIGSGFDKCEYIPKNTHIHILGEKKNIGDYLYFSDFFVLTSLMEGLPLSLLEAMSMGVIPVTTPAGGIKDVIRNRENGYISKTFELNDFINTIEIAIKEHKCINKEYLINEFNKFYSMRACASQYFNLYSKSINNKISI